MKKLLGLFIVSLPLTVSADTVVTIDSVESYVNIRSAPEEGADVIGRLQKGIPLPHVATWPGWHEVVVSEGLTGFVSADWSEVVADEEVTEPATIEEPQAAAEPEAATQTAVEQPEIELQAEAQTEPEQAAAIAEVAPEAAEDPEPAQPPAIEAPPVEPVPATAAVEPVVITGPPGPPGPPGPAGAATIEGRPGFLVRFKAPTLGESSQVFDDGNRVGIGTTSPAQRLEVNGSIQINEQNSGVAGLMITQSSGDTGYIMHNRASTLTIGAGSVDRITIDREGNVGIGVTRPSHPLELANGAYVSVGGVWTNSSSRNSKDNIAVLSAREALGALDGLEPVRYTYKNDSRESYVGFIAEDVPELVATNDRSGLSAMDIVAVLTRVVQAQQQKIEELELRLDAMD